uniref:Sushi domain-containing protein n=1 Tax=Hippocampus comes TaxID=109280 RepID=A0A3Q2XXQ9_HIPCM
TNVTTMFCDCAKTLNFGGCQTDSYISCAIIRPPRDGGIRYRGLTQDVQILPVDYEIEYICRGNRVIVGPKVRKCLPNGTWTDMTQHSSCREYSSLYLYSGMGMRRLPPGPPVEGSVLHYRCHSGFILEGRNVSHCTKLGKWDAPKPICLCERISIHEGKCGIPDTDADASADIRKIDGTCYHTGRISPTSCCTHWSI